MNKIKLSSILSILVFVFMGTNLFSQDFVYDWVRSAGGERWDLANDIVIDSEKNVYMAGGFEQTAFFGNDSIVSAGGRDIFIAKYDSLGTLVWLKKAGGKKYDNAIDMEIDNENNILLTGNFQDTSYFDTQELSTESYMNNFIAKYSSDGNLIQIKKIDADTRAKKLFITLTSNNDFFLSGTYYNSMNIDGDTLQAEGKTDMFIARFGNDFTCKSLVNMGGFANNTLKDIKYFENDLYLLSEFTDSIDINENRYWSYGSSDVLMIKSDTTGNILNEKHFAGFGEDTASSLIIDADSSIYLSSEFESVLYFDEDSLISKGGKDILLMKTDNDFNTLWYKQIGSSTNEYANTLLKNTANAIYLTGSFTDSLKIANKGIVSKNSTADMFIAKYSPEGENIGLKQSGGTGYEFNNVVINDPDNYLYIIGNFAYDFAFETDSISSDSIFAANDEDVFIARFYDCDYAKYPDLGNDTSFCDYGVLKVLNAESSKKWGEIFGKYKKYKWNNGQSGRQIVVYDSGYYSVTTIDSHKCQVTSDSIFVAVNPKPTPNLGEDITTVAGETIELFGGNFSTYLWSNDSITERITINTDSLEDNVNYFTLTATNEYNCTEEDEVIIFIEAPTYGASSPNQGQGTNTNNTNTSSTGKSNDTNGSSSSNNANIGNIGISFGNNFNKEITEAESLVYPNPNKGHFYVNISKIEEEIKNIKIYTAESKKVYEEANIETNNLEINIKTRGVHYLVIETENKVFFEKFIVR